MRCLYEVLEVERTADDAAIKTSYRKAALKWHPDKNKGDEGAEERFKEVQNAYEVLSDKHERAWYDAHRLDILRGNSRHQAGGSSSVPAGQAPDDEADLFPYFSSTCFSGYKDGPMGFYGVYEDIFATLNRQEKEFAATSDEGQSAQDLSGFGTSQSQWTDVAAFYSTWSSFSTCKSFSWADQYHPGSAPNRKVRRLMEEENRKARKAKRREFNDTVRELVAFVKKRDKRVAAHQAEEAKRRLEREAADAVRKEEERQARLQRAREYEEAQWAQQEDEDEEDDSEEDIQIVQNDLYCVACDKTFRSQNAMANHERSKKHLENVEVLRAMLEEEEDEVDGLIPEKADSESSLSDTANDEPSLQTASAVNPAEHEASSNLGHHRVASGNALSEDDEATLHSEDDPGTDKASAEGSEDEDEDNGEDEEGYASESDMLAALLKIQSQQSKEQSSKHQAASGSSSIASVSAEENIDEACNEHPPPSCTDESGAVCIEDAGVSEDDTTRGSGKGKKKRRRRQKDAKTSQHTQLPSVSNPADTHARKGSRSNPKGAAHKEERRKGTAAKASVYVDPETAQTACSVCHAEFASRSKLFKHIKESGHIALKP